MRPAEAVERLAAAGCVDASGEVDEMLRWAPQGVAGWTVPADWVRRRSLGEPLSWVTGHAPFGGIDVQVVPGVYPPRPWSAELALTATSALAPEGRLLDLCTGCGAVAALVAQRRPGALVIGVDLDPVAADCARSNGVVAVAGDLAEPLRPDILVGHRFDVVTAVAPYVPSGSLDGLARDVRDREPVAALDGGSDGLDVVRRVVDAAARVLHRGGSLHLELGGDQDSVLAPDLAAAGFSDLVTWHDDDGALLGLSCVRS